MSLSASSTFIDKQARSRVNLCSNPAHLDQPLVYTCTVDDCEKRFVCKVCFEADADHSRQHRGLFSNTSYLLDSGIE